jgi:subtilase family serine protease
LNARSGALASFVLVAVAACSANGSSTPSVTQTESGTSLRTAGSAAIPACTGSRKGRAQCDVLIRIGVAQPDGGSGPAGGYTPAQLQSAYNLPSSSNGSGQIVAIVDAYDNPNVASDLATYRSYFGLPAANFQKYNQTGGQSGYPQGSPYWGVETDLDVEMVSASCPNCTIYLVEANSSVWADLEIAEAEAVKLGSHIVSNSYNGAGAEAKYYDKKGVTYLASAGDEGYDNGPYGLGDPVSFPSVVAVGGTTLTQGGGSRGWTETVWPGSGAGCSKDLKPKWQHDPGCKFRTADDVSAVADPSTGVSEYDSYGYGGWVISGGTSVSSPFLAGVFALAGNATSQKGGQTFWLRKHQSGSDLFPITSGSDGNCSPRYLCTAGTHEYRDYSGPGAWGTPNGIGAF